MEQVCLFCNRSFPPKRPGQKYCSQVCGGRATKGSRRTPNGKVVIQKGYAYVRKDGTYVRRVRLLMQEHLGRPLLPEERVHHINENKLDDRIENLVLCDSHSEHRTKHSRVIRTETHKQCGVCRIVLPRSEFHAGPKMGPCLAGRPEIEYLDGV